MQAAGPVAQRDRIAELDVLRGVALFGVLLANFVGFAGADVMATENQLRALPTARWDGIALFLCAWLVADKANTMFATLFGLGFYLQMTRSEGRPGFARRYSRRLFWLLVFGALNMTLLWVWDILNLYAIASFFLLAMRRWSTRALLIFGVVAALYSAQLQELLLKSFDISLMDWNPYSDAAVLERQQAALAGDYPRLVELFWRYTWEEWLVGATILSWTVYALGRFALGAAIGRSGILSDVPAHLPLLRRIAKVALPAGLLVSLALRLMTDGHWQPLGAASEGTADVLRAGASLVLAAGYASVIVLACNTRRGGRFFALFGPVGQMALTNYLAQGLAYGLVLTDVGPGLGLAGSIGSLAVWGVCIAFFALQIAFSHWWLSRFRFGPLEWLWRALTYGAVPPMRRAPVQKRAPA